MDKIYTVTISFEDWESSSYNTVGFFSDKKMAEKELFESKGERGNYNPFSLNGRRSSFGPTWSKN